MQVKPGLEVFLEKHLDLVQGKRVGLVTNPTGIDSQLKSNIGLLAGNEKVEITALYGPEHGLKGDAQAGQGVPYTWDKRYQLPIYSLYGSAQKVHPQARLDLDAIMRDYDIRSDGKLPEKNMLDDIEVLIFDIQDIGTRIYTYIATMAFCMQACAEKGISFIVLDRPNPLNGITMEGPVLDYPRFSTFVGLYPIPVRHGMTIGELAGFFNANFLQPPVALKVIPMAHWSRDMWFKDTGLPWICPSPNIPRPETAAVYPGQVFLEGTNLSEGRGTTLPFESFGAPWIDPAVFCDELNQKKLPGIFFRETWFIPQFSKHRFKLCGGAQLHILDQAEYLPFFTALTVLSSALALYRPEIEFYPEYFDRIMGTDQVRRALYEEIPVAAILEKYAPEIREFAELRSAYLLY